MKSIVSISGWLGNRYALAFILRKHGHGLVKHGHGGYLMSENSYQFVRRSSEPIRPSVQYRYLVSSITHLYTATGVPVARTSMKVRAYSHLTQWPSRQSRYLLGQGSSLPSGRYYRDTHSRLLDQSLDSMVSMRAIVSRNTLTGRSTNTVESCFLPGSSGAP